MLRAFRNANEAGCRPIAVVTGEAYDRIKMELSGTQALVVENPEWRHGLGTSIRCGVRLIQDSGADLENVVRVHQQRGLIEERSCKADVAVGAHQVVGWPVD